MLAKCRRNRALPAMLAEKMIAPHYSRRDRILHYDQRVMYALLAGDESIAYFARRRQHSSLRSERQCTLCSKERVVFATLKEQSALLALLEGHSILRYAQGAEGIARYARRRKYSSLRTGSKRYCSACSRKTIFSTDAQGEDDAHFAREERKITRDASRR
jgi:hypothetical protein